MRAMLVRDIGEFPLIDRLAEAIKGESEALIKRVGPNGYRLRLSIGDDAAAWESPSGTRVFTTDTMVEGVHFSLDNISWHDLGWKSLAVNLSLRSSTESPAKQRTSSLRSSAKVSS